MMLTGAVGARPHNVSIGSAPWLGCQQGRGALKWNRYCYASGRMGPRHSVRGRQRSALQAAPSRGSSASQTACSLLWCLRAPPSPISNHPRGAFTFCSFSGDASVVTYRQNLSSSVHPILVLVTWQEHGQTDLGHRALCKSQITFISSYKRGMLAAYLHSRTVLSRTRKPGLCGKGLGSSSRWADVQR